MVMTQQDRRLQVILLTISASSGKIKAIISNFAECEVGRKLEEKFETFLEEGLLDPLLQYIVKDSEKDGDLKVGYNNKRKMSFILLNNVIWYDYLPVIPM